MKLSKKTMLFFIFVSLAYPLLCMKNEDDRKILLALSCGFNLGGLFDALHNVAESGFAIKYKGLNIFQKEEQYEKIYNNIGYTCIHSMSLTLSGLLMCYSKTDILGAEKPAVFFCNAINAVSIMHKMFLLGRYSIRKEISLPILFHTGVHLLTFASMGYIDNFFSF